MGVRKTSLFRLCHSFWRTETSLSYLISEECNTFVKASWWKHQHNIALINQTAYHPHHFVFNWMASAGLHDISWPLPPLHLLFYRGKPDFLAKCNHFLIIWEIFPFVKIKMSQKYVVVFCKPTRQNWNIIEGFIRPSSINCFSCVLDCCYLD